MSPRRAMRGVEAMQADGRGMIAAIAGLVVLIAVVSVVALLRDGV